MQQFTLSEAAAWTGGTCTADPVITSVVRDAREAGPGSLFVAIKGERFDGHDFIGQAIERGAAAVLTHRKDETYSIPALYVEDTRQGLLDLAGGYRAQFDCPVVAVTGSVGKTTTKEMIASVLSERYDTLKTRGNLNNTIGMPLTALEMDENTEAAVFEMGMSAFGESAAMAACGQPNIAVITMIGTSHIEFLGSREGICRAKMEILEGLAARGGIAVLNGDEPLLWEQKDRLFGRIVWFGQNNPDCEFRAEDISCTDGTLRFTLIWPEGRKTVEVASQGTHNVGNALAAAACGWLLGLDGDDMAAGLAAYRPVGMREQRYEKNGFAIYQDCYNASPDSMEAALRVLGEMSGKRRFAVLGCMGELGDYAPDGHRRAGRAAAQYADYLFAYGPDTAYLKEGAVEAGMDAARIACFDTHEALAEALRAAAQPGDALLFKGSRAMKMENALKLFLGEEVES